MSSLNTAGEEKPLFTEPLPGSKQGGPYPLALGSHLAYPRCPHSRKAQRSSLLSLVHHSACPPHPLQTGTPGSLLWDHNPENTLAWVLAKMKLLIHCHKVQSQASDEARAPEREGYKTEAEATALVFLQL